MIDVKFEEKTNAIIKSIDKFLDEIKDFKDFNKNKAKERIACGLIVRYNVLSNFIFNSQNFYLEYKKKNEDYDRQQVIDFEYKISDYAHNIYDIMEYCIMIYATSKNRDFFNKITTDDILQAKSNANRLLHIGSRWHSLRVMEVFDLQKKALDKHEVPRRRIFLKAPTYTVDRLLATRLGIKFKDNIQPNEAVIAMPTNTCKTYCANALDLLSTANSHIHYGMTGVHRVMNTSTNAEKKHDLVIKMLTSTVMLKIFPEYIKYLKGDKLDIFARKNQDVKLLKDTEIGEDSFVSDGIDTDINSKRIEIGTIVDDCSGGDKDAENDDMHIKHTTTVNGDVKERLNSDNCYFVKMGTCYNPNDPQLSTIDIWESTCNMQQHPDYTDIRYSKDGKKITCICPVEDKNGKSRVPLIHSDEELKGKKLYLQKVNKMHLYNLKYMQQADSREIRPFAWNSLITYNSEDLEGLTEYTQSQIDPSRRSGKNYFAQTFFKKGVWFNELTNKKEEVWFLTDVIFKQKSLGIKDDKDNRFRLEVIKKIYDNKCFECNVEDNTSNTTTIALSDALRAKYNYTGCKFYDTTTTGNRGETKITRILEMEETIKTKIIFPSVEYANLKGGDLLTFMLSLSKWDDKMGQKEKNVDDAPDNLQLFSRKFIVPTIKPKSHIEKGGANKLFNGGRSSRNRVGKRYW